MKSTNSFRKIAIDMSWLQLSWAAWFLIIALLAYMILPIFGVDVDTDNKLGQFFAKIASGKLNDAIVHVDNGGFYAFLSHPANIFMLVCGILSAPSFLTFFVKQGLTRKNYFYGSAIASFVLALVIALVVGGIVLIERAFFASDLQLNGSWLFAVVAFALHILTYYGAGWLIGAGFYRYGAMGGMLFIVLAIAIVFAIEVLWENGLAELLGVNELSESLLLVLSTVVLLAAILTVIRVMTKRVRIKLK